MSKEFSEKAIHDLETSGVAHVEGFFDPDETQTHLDTISEIMTAESSEEFFGEVERERWNNFKQPFFPFRVPKEGSAWRVIRETFLRPIADELPDNASVTPKVLDDINQIYLPRYRPLLGGQVPPRIHSDCGRILVHASAGLFHRYEINGKHLDYEQGYHTKPGDVTLIAPRRLDGPYSHNGVFHVGQNTSKTEERRLITFDHIPESNIRHFLEPEDIGITVRGDRRVFEVATRTERPLW